MKLFCFLTSLIFVNVSTDDLMDYQTNIAITNAHIQRAFGTNIVGPNFIESVLEQVIKSIIEDDNTYSLGAILNMIAIPDTPLENDFEESAIHQTVLREIIENEHEIEVPEVPESDYRRLTLKDLGNRRRAYTKRALKNIFHMDVVGSQEEFSELWVCRLIALFMSAKFPMSYIRDIETDTDECMTFDGFSTETYKRVMGEWRHVFDNVNFSSLESVFVL
ncbi:uncharacterized protein LOC126835415 [Adelges cooleyi]|uniref:uncharacterized protein LOC126835415 n=1 Tax=Adelges cooleyi TaxID=133065 RepID=UPI0021801D70|nr:uncharacterized protein LOC126835415 [Adelges cooleyi]